MDGVVLYLIVMLVQGTGPVAGGFGSIEACNEARQELVQAADPSVLAISKCIPVPLAEPPVKT